MRKIEIAPIRTNPPTTPPAIPLLLDEESPEEVAVIAALEVDVDVMEVLVMVVVGLVG